MVYRITAFKDRFIFKDRILACLMPLRQTVQGGECPLGKFQPDNTSEFEYTSDPVMQCLRCDFYNPIHPDFILDKICLCPSDMTPELYENLREEYISLVREGIVKRQDLSKEGFQNFARDNYERLKSSGVKN